MCADSSKDSDDEVSNSSVSGNELELDSPDFESSREQVVRQIVTLEKQFHALKQELCQERLRQVNLRICELRDGSALEYKRQIDELKNHCENLCQVALVNKKFRISEIERVFESGQLSAAQDRENEEKLLVDSIRTQLETTINKLKEDKRENDVSLALWMQKQQDKHCAKEKKYINQSNRAVPVLSPFIVYMLAESEIDEDCDVVARAIIESKLARD